jgi:hypothetical protein
MQFVVQKDINYQREIIPIELLNTDGDPSTSLRTGCHALLNQGVNSEPSVATEAQ